MNVVVTGWGVVAAAGAGRDASAGAFRDGILPLTEIDRAAGYHRPKGARLAATVDGVDLSDWLSPRQARRMSPPSRLAVVSAQMALEMAGSKGRSGETDAAETSVVTATSFGPSSYTEDLLRQILLDAPISASPFLFSEAVANASAAQIALLLRATGPNLTVTQREASPLLALAHGVEIVRRGRAGRVLVTAVDECNPLLHAILDRFGVLAGSRAGSGGVRPAEIGRPFDRRRCGLVTAAGATTLLLEPAEAAAARGAEPLAEIAATFSGFDPEAPAVGWGRDPAPLARALARGLARHGIDPASVDLVISGASGTRDGDRLEALVLREVFVRSSEASALDLPPIVAPKAYAGEHGGALLTGALLAAEGAEMAATPGFREVDPELGVVPFQGGPLPRVRRILVQSLAAGGSAAWAVLDLAPND